MLKHGTIEIRKKFSTSVSNVFEAFADINKRQKWAVPTGQQIRYLQSNFSVGGIDIALCGDPTQMNFKTIAYYCDIEKNQRIIFTESVLHKESLISVALNCLEFYSSRTGCEIKMTIQVSDLSGGEVKANYKQGWEAVFKNLSEQLESDEDINA